MDLTATDLRFADDPNVVDLDVTLQTSLADLATTNLSTSLTALADMGIDTVNLINSLSELDAVFNTITGETGTAVVIQGGIDGLDLGATDLRFTDSGANDLNVRLDVTDDIVNGTVSLSTTNLSALNDMGIDTITGDNGTSVVIQGFTNDFTLSDLEALGLNFADGGDDGSDLIVTLDMTDAGSSVMLDITEAGILRDMGIDFINGPNGQFIDFDMI